MREIYIYIYIILTLRPVLQWDHSLHVEGTKLWVKGILADGGEHFQAYSNMSGEPIIEGMVVGTAKDKHSPAEREEVCISLYPIHPRCSESLLSIVTRKRETKNDGLTPYIFSTNSTFYNIVYSSNVQNTTFKLNS